AQGTRFDDLARGLHTLKGSAATLGLEELADFAHRMEDAVLPLRGSADPLPAPLADAVLKALDVWMARLRATSAKTELPDLKPSYELLRQVAPRAAPLPAAPPTIPEPVREAEVMPADSNPPVPAVPAEDGASGESWRVST